MAEPRPNPRVAIQVLENLVREADRAGVTHIAVADIRHAIGKLKAGDTKGTVGP